MTRHRNFWYSLIAVGLAAAVLLAGVSVYRLGQALDAITRQGEDTAFTASQLRDCLTPGGECFEAARRLRDRAAAVQIVSAGCAAGFMGLDGERRVEATQRCVTTWLHRHRLDER
jgi:hypothetical protein